MKNLRRVLFLVFVSCVFLMMLMNACNQKASDTSSSADSTRADSVGISSMDTSAKQDTLIARMDSTKKDSTKKMEDYHPDRTPASIPKSDTTNSAIRTKPIDVKIFYGTDRKVIFSQGNSVSYGEESSDISETYKVGYTIVTVPPHHVPGTTDDRHWYKFEFSDDTMKNMVQTRTVRLTDPEFDQMLSRSKKGLDAFIFVHGFNNSFHDAALRTAQLWADIKLPVVPFMFSWSSNGKARSYERDGESVQVAVPAFESYLKRIARLGNYKRIHLIAHSMGNRLISSALWDMRSDTANLKIDQIIMAAPDVYADQFRKDYAAALSQRCHRVTVYSAANDWALQASNGVSGHARLGQVAAPPFQVNNDHVNIIDATRQRTDFLGHGRFASSIPILSDISAIFNKGLDPVARKIPHRVVNHMMYFYFN